MHGGLASALGHEGKPIGFFAEEPFRIEPFGLGQHRPSWLVP